MRQGKTPQVPTCFPADKIRVMKMSLSNTNDAHKD